MTTYDLIYHYLRGTLGNYPVAQSVVESWKVRVTTHYEHLRDDKAMWTDHHSNLASLLLDLEEYLIDWIARYPKKVTHDPVQDELPL